MCGEDFTHQTDRWFARATRPPPDTHLIGDCALLGFPIKGHVTAASAGHASIVEFVMKLKKEYSEELDKLRNGDIDG